MKKKVAAITTIALLSSAFGTSAFASSYQVQKGDTLTKIAKNHHISVTQLKTLNNLSSDHIYINQTLKLTKATSSKAPVVAPTATKPTTPKATVTTYTVVTGDSLSKIASKYKISLSDLVEWNGLENDMIFPGQKLKVKGSSIVTETPEPEKPKPNTASEYIVQNGDTLGHISSKFNMTIEELKSLNNLSSHLIYVGQKLAVTETTIPGKESIENEAPVDSTHADRLITQAKKWVGTPYAWGGSTLDGFDCSGFIYYAFNEVGTELSRQSTEGYYSRSHYVDQPRVGDLVFFENTYKQGISHMGIYLGNNEFIHASASKGVTISSLEEAYYQQRFDGFKRFY